MNRIIVFITVFFIASCGGNKDEQHIVTDSTSSIAAHDSVALVTSDQSYFWSVEDDGKGNLELKKIRPISPDSLNYTSVLAMLNSLYPEVKMEVKKLSNDTLFLKTDNGKYLTQRMGSTGAFNYLKEVTYNLTEVNKIHYVNFEFKEGDHAQPGTYSRSDFVNEK